MMPPTRAEGESFLALVRQRKPAYKDIAKYVRKSTCNRSEEHYYACFGWRRRTSAVIEYVFVIYSTIEGYRMA
jgi:hypothetical protein